MFLRGHRTSYLEERPMFYSAGVGIGRVGKSMKQSIRRSPRSSLSDVVYEAVYEVA
jgi:hypothetical protein